jgi:hypothetical protein
MSSLATTSFVISYKLFIIIMLDIFNIISDKASRGYLQGVAGTLREWTIA